MMSLSLWLVLGVAVVGGVYVLATGRHKVKTGHIGVVFFKYGFMRPGDKRFKVVRAYGSPGYQAETLDPDRVYLRPRLLYKVTDVKLTSVSPSTIGLVVAKDGAKPPDTRTLGEHVECENFEDGRTFLLDGGQKGRQLGILPGDASYAINTELFDVITFDTVGAGRDDLTKDDLREVTVPAGATGVVVVYAGKRADEDERVLGRIVPGHESFQLPWVFLDNDGQRGVQEETLSRGGVYRINPWFARVVLVPTRVIVLEWKKKKDKPPGNFDKSLDQIRINVEGHWLRFDMTQTIRIPAKAAPRLVSQFGERETGMERGSDSVQRFVGNVLGPLVEGYFQRAAGRYEVLEFVSDAKGVRTDLADQVRHALEPWGIEAVDTALGEFEPEETTLDEFRRRLARQRDRKRELEHQQENTEIEEKIKERQLDTERKRRRLEVVELEAQIELLGKDNVSMERFIAELVKANVPEVVAGNAESLLGYMSLPIARDMISKAFRRVEPGRESAVPRLSSASSEYREGRLLDSRVSQQEIPSSWRGAAVYTSSDDGAELKRALVEVLDHFGLELVADGPPVPGSRLQRGWVKIKGAAESEPVRKRIRELENALKYHATGKVGVEVAKAVRALLVSVNRQESAAIRLGSLFVVKASNRVALWVVSELEAAELEKNDDLLANPTEIFAQMQRFGNSLRIQS